MIVSVRNLQNIRKYEANKMCMSVEEIELKKAKDALEIAQEELKEARKKLKKMSSEKKKSGFSLFKKK